MSYYRLTDVKTPPFAYVVNKEDIIQTCRSCQMPFRQLAGRLRVEICQTEGLDRGEEWQGLPMMADHWLIGDRNFGNRLEALCPGHFDRLPLEIIAWRTRGPEAGIAQETPKDWDFYLFQVRAEIGLKTALLNRFPLIHCSTCGRDLPEIPFDLQPQPSTSENQPCAAALENLYFEGYDYLFHGRIVGVIEKEFPTMILEKLAAEPAIFEI